MSTVAVIEPKYKSDYRKTDLCRKKIYGADFTKQDLSELKLRQSLFYNCSFNGANMTETDCEGSEFFGSTFIDTICYRTNFKDAKLANTKFEPKDAFGITLTMQCKTFEGMDVSPLWWLGWVFFATMMHPVRPLDNEPLQEKLIGGVLGAERYVKLKGLFVKREL